MSPSSDLRAACAIEIAGRLTWGSMSLRGGPDSIMLGTPALPEVDEGDAALPCPCPLCDMSLWSFSVAWHSEASVVSKRRRCIHVHSMQRPMIVITNAMTLKQMSWLMKRQGDGDERADANVRCKIGENLETDQTLSEVGTKTAPHPTPTMVLPLLPAIESFGQIESTSAQLTKSAFAAIGQVLFHGNSGDVSQILGVLPTLSTVLDLVADIRDLSLDETIQLLDAGAAKIIVAKAQLADLKDIPPERLIVRLTEAQVATPADIEEVAQSVAGIIIDSTCTVRVDPGSLKSIVGSVRKSYLPTGGNRMVYLEYSATSPPPTIAELKSLALLSIEPILPAACLTSSHKDFPHLLSVSQIAFLGSKTDRPDGLYATVVVDERGHALGLVYSSAESVAESIRTGTGVYQSRERGLWYKGATSGATQEVLGISWDCDADCLRFTVKQAGKGPQAHGNSLSNVQDFVTLTVEVVSVP